MIDGVENLFWEFAVCTRCNKRYDGCKCSIVMPVLTLAGFENLISKIRKMEVEDGTSC